MKKHLIVIFILGLFLISCSNTTVSNTDKEEKYNIIRGMNYIKIGKNEEALESFKLAYRINPRNISTIRSIGLLYCALNNTVEGEHYFYEALKINPKDSVTLYNLSVIYYQDKNYYKALEILGKIPAEGINDDIIKERAYIYFEIKDYKRSCNEFEKLIGRDNILYDSYFYNTYIIVLKNLNHNDKIYPFLSHEYENHKDNQAIVITFARYLKSIEIYDYSENILKKYGTNYDYTNPIIYELAELYFIKKDYVLAHRYIELIKNEEKYSKAILEFKIKLSRAEGKEDEANKYIETLNMTQNKENKMPINNITNNKKIEDIKNIKADTSSKDNIKVNNTAIIKTNSNIVTTENKINNKELVNKKNIKSKKKSNNKLVSDKGENIGSH